MRMTTNRVVTDVCFEKEIFSALEKARGIASRSAYINQLLKEHFGIPLKESSTSPGEV